MTTATIPIQQCGHCGCIHSGACPRVKRIEYHENGTIKAVEYHDPMRGYLGGTIISRPDAAIEVTAIPIPYSAQQAIGSALSASQTDGTTRFLDPLPFE